MRAVWLCAVVSLFLAASAATPVSCATWHIYQDGSGDFPTIAAAVAGAASGDSVLVHPGTYNEHDINVTKQLFIVSVSGAASTVIDAQASGRCFIFKTQTSLIVLRGFTLRRGTGAFDPTYNGYGGAIIARHLANVFIADCIFSDNTSNLGAGIMARDSSTVSIKRCSFVDNLAYTDNFPGAGGAICMSGVNPPNYMLTVVVDSCVFVNNTAESDGGAVSMSFCDAWIMNSTFHQNYAASGRGTIALSYAGIALERSIVSSSNCYGIIAWFSLLSSSFSCNDFYGNAAGNYGGLISDQTGTNDNISADPLFCGAPDDLSIPITSPCAPANSPCGELIGRFGTSCGPNLLVAGVQWSGSSLWPGINLTMTVKIKNAGGIGAGPFYIDYYEDRATAPPEGLSGDERHSVSSLAAGDSVSWTTSPVTSDYFAEWQSWFRVDTDAQVSETNEGDNLSGPHAIRWVAVPEGAWPMGVGAGFHSSPVIASIDENLLTREVAIGCDNGRLYVFMNYGGTVSGFPVRLDGPVYSSPAVGNITGDFWNEIVVGCDDGYLYAFDRRGTLLWRYLIGGNVRTTPALGDLDGDGLLDIICASGTKICVINGDGKPLEGWPYEEDVTFAGVAVGDVDWDDDLEIAAVARSGESVSKVYLFLANGESYSVSWPVQLDAILQAGPAIGNIQTIPIRRNEIAVGATSGNVYVLRTDGSVWFPVPQVAGSISTPPTIADVDGDGDLDIVVTSKIYALGGDPPVMRWNGYVTAISGSGSVISGWPQSAGFWASDVGPIPSAVAVGAGRDIFAESPSAQLFAWHGSGVRTPTFPYPFLSSILVSAAAGNVDGDEWIEIYTASSDGVIWCYELRAPGYTAADLWWPMYGYDPARTFCYGSDVSTGTDEDADTAPDATRLAAVYPNPFNPSTRITFDVRTAGRVQIVVYDVTGRTVAVLQDGELGAGRHEVSWNGATMDGTAASSGIYFCALRTGDFLESRKIVLLR